MIFFCALFFFWLYAWQWLYSLLYSEFQGENGKKIQKLTPEVFYKKGVLIAKKETLTQMFSCEFYEIFQSTFFSEHLWELLNWIFLS